MNFREDDTRGQAILIGVLLLFAMTVIALGGLQTFMVPEQNAGVAQESWEASEQDMLEVRAAMEQNTSASMPVELGRRLPDRPFLIEGTPPHGTLETSGGLDITIQGDGIAGAPVDDGDGVITTGDLTDPDAGEPNDLVYTQSGGDWETLSKWLGPVSTFTRQDGATASLTEQSGETINVVLMYGDVSLSSADTKSLDVETVHRSCTVVGGDDGTTEITVARSGSGIEDREIDWDTGETKRVCLVTVGLDGADVSAPPELEDDDDGADEGMINPHGEGMFELDSSSISGTDVTATFLNNDTDSRTVTKIRLPYATAPGVNSGSIDVTVPSAGSVSVGVGEGSVSVPDRTWTPSNTRDIEFSGLNGPPNSALAVELHFSDGSTSLYFVSFGTGGDGDGDCDTPPCN